MTRPTRQEMITRERMRLQGMSHLDLYKEMYDWSPAELISDLMRHYEEDLDKGYIVPCSSCGEDCAVDEPLPTSECICEDCEQAEPSEF